MHTPTRLVATLGVGLVVLIAIGLSSAPKILETRAYRRPSAERAQVPPELFLDHLRLRDGRSVTLPPAADDYAVRTGTRSPLLLLLPDGRERPYHYTEFLRSAREAGYHVLALDIWDDGRSDATVCGADANCYTALQRNRFDGADPGRFSSVDPENTIVYRLRAAIDRLSAADPAGGWGRFATGRGIEWSDVVLAGQGQGGDESAYIAHRNRVLGLLMFSSPIGSYGEGATWLSGASATPAARMYGFDDVGDALDGRIRSSWNALGMGAFGAPENVANGLIGNSHELISTARLGTPLRAAALDLTNASPAAGGGHPVFQTVWDWMLDRVWSGRHSDRVDRV